MYLNAADKQNLPAYKRFFNQQALFRNSMFNEFSALLSNFNVEVEDVLLKRANIRLLMMTSIQREKSNPFIKSLSQDQLFKENLCELITVDQEDKNQLIYHRQLTKINASIEENKCYNKEMARKEMLVSDFTDSNL